MNRFLRPSFNRFPVKRLSNALRGPVIGINFGFTNSSVAILEDRKAKVLKNDEGSILTPSVVAFTKDDEILVGAPAIRQSVLNSQNTIFGIKRLIGRKYDEKEVLDFMKDIPYKIIRNPNADVLIEVQDKLYSPSQIASFILLKLKKTAENYLNKKVSNAIITVPAYFNDSQRKLIKEAGRLANLRISNIFNESAVAAFAYNLDIGSNDLIAICDYGGTFDISFLKKNEKYFEVKSANAHPFSCGIDFDNVIVNYLVDEFKREKGIDLVKDPIAMQRLHEAAEKAKCILSYSDQTKIILPNITTDSNGLKHFEYKLSRSKFEQLNDDLFKKAGELCSKSLDNENLKPDDISQVLLIGGMSRMPKIKQIVEDIFRRKTREVEIKDEFIAIGALNLGVILGDVNYLNGLKTNVGRKGTKASQNFYYAQNEFCDISLFEAFFHTIKEYYANFHIEVAKKVSDKLSTQAIFDLGDFATDFAPRKVGERWSELSDTLSRVRSFEQCHNHESFSEKWVEELCDSVAIFIKKFPLINKKKVNNSINKYLLTINNDKVPREVLFKKYGIERIKFKRIIKRNLLKRYIFKSGKSRRKQKFEKFVLFKAFPIKIY